MRLEESLSMNFAYRYTKFSNKANQFKELSTHILPYKLYPHSFGQPLNRQLSPRTFVIQTIMFTKVMITHKLIVYIYEENN